MFVQRFGDLSSSIAAECRETPPKRLFWRSLSRFVATSNSVALAPDPQPVTPFVARDQRCARQTGGISKISRSTSSGTPSRNEPIASSNWVQGQVR